MTPEPEATDLPFKIGRQFLVVIGIGAYESWTPLQHPVADAREIRDILVSRYRVDQLRELYDGQATKAAIIRLLADLQQEIQPDDSLMVLYFGHGHLDKKSDSGFWIPVDAGTDVYEQRNWLPHSQLKGLISKVASTHVFIVSDSCFSGDLLFAMRSLPANAEAGYLRTAYSLVCRQVLTSGAVEAVPDSSDFAVQLKSALRRNTAPILDTYMLYNEIRLGVKSTVPLLGALPGTGSQEGAGFLLFLRDDLVGREPPIDPRGSSAAAKRSDGAFWVGGGFSFLVPVLAAASTLNNTPSISSHLLYAVPTPYGKVGVLFLTGAMGTETKDRGDTGYQMISFPAALGLRYETAPSSSLFLCLDVSGGVMFSMVRFLAPGAQPVSTAKPFIEPSLSAGWQLSERFRIGAGCGWETIFFDGSWISMVAPFLRVEYGFLTP
jgi:hypothetical protein